MLFSRSARPSRRSRAARTAPVLALGVSTLALALSTAVPAGAAPGGASNGSTARESHPQSASAASRSSSASTSHRTSSTEKLTAAAKRAGLEPGNATMGWRERGIERATGGPQLRFGLAAVASSSSSSFTPDGVLGIDISSYQGNLKWSKWTKRERQFAYVKATEGTSYKNPYFKNQYGGAADAGMIRGAYHFASPNGKAGYKQARYFVKNGGGWSPDGHTLPGVLDIEYNPYGSTCYGISKKKMVAWISSFTTEYKKLTGKDAVIYTTTDWWKQCTGNSDAFGDTNPLWIARYGTKKPGTLPKGWTYATFWQYTSDPIDQDVFGNKLKRLKVLATKA